MAETVIPPWFLMAFLSKCILQFLHILVQILKGDNQINCWPINRMVTHRSTVHPWSNCCSHRDEFYIANTSGKQVLERAHVLAALTPQSPDRNWSLLLFIFLLLLILLWLLFYRKLPFMISQTDRCSSVLKSWVVGLHLATGSRHGLGPLCFLTTEVTLLPLRRQSWQHISSQHE